MWVAVPARHLKVESWDMFGASLCAGFLSSAEMRARDQGLCLPSSADSSGGGGLGLGGGDGG